MSLSKVKHSLNNALPQSVPHLVLVDGRVPVLSAQLRRDKVVNFLSEVLVGGLAAHSDSDVNSVVIQRTKSNILYMYMKQQLKEHTAKSIQIKLANVSQLNGSQKLD